MFLYQNTQICSMKTNKKRLVSLIMKKPSKYVELKQSSKLVPHLNQNCRYTTLNFTQMAI